MSNPLQPMALVELSALRRLPHHWQFQLRQPTDNDPVEKHLSYTTFCRGFTCYMEALLTKDVLPAGFELERPVFHVPEEAMGFLWQHFSNIEQMVSAQEKQEEKEAQCARCGATSIAGKCPCHQQHWCTNCLLVHLLCPFGERSKNNARRIFWDDAVDSMAWTMRGQAFRGYSHSTEASQATVSRPMPQGVREAMSVLGIAVSPAPTPEQVKVAYRRLVQTTHPDHGGESRADGQD